jgi:hypothetical protein
VGHRHAGHLRKRESREVVRAAGAGGAVGHLARVRLRVVDEFLQVRRGPNPGWETRIPGAWTSNAIGSKDFA